MVIKLVCIKIFPKPIFKISDDQLSRFQDVLLLKFPNPKNNFENYRFEISKKNKGVL